MSRATSDNFVAKALQTTSDFVNDQPERSFATYVRGKTPQPVSLTIPFFVMEGMPKMTESTRAAILKANRAKYHRTPVASPSPSELPAAPGDFPSW